MACLFNRFTFGLAKGDIRSERTCNRAYYQIFHVLYQIEVKFAWVADKI